MKLRLNEKSIIFARGDDLNEITIKRLSRSKYDKDKVLVNLCKEFKKEVGQVKNLKTVTVINTPFTPVTQRGDILRAIDSSMQLIHTDIVDLIFFSESAIAPKYYLLCVYLFSSKVYLYQIKKSQLAKKLEKFYLEIEQLRSYLKSEGRYRMRLQRDQEFNQNKIKKLNSKHNVEHYNTKLNEGHTVPV